MVIKDLQLHQRISYTTLSMCPHIGTQNKITFYTHQISCSYSSNQIQVLTQHFHSHSLFPKKNNHFYLSFGFRGLRTPVNRIGYVNLNFRFLRSRETYVRTFWLRYPHSGFLGPVKPVTKDTKRVIPGLIVYLSFSIQSLSKITLTHTPKPFPNPFYPNSHQNSI